MTSQKGTGLFDKISSDTSCAMHNNINPHAMLASWKGIQVQISAGRTSKPPWRQTAASSFASRPLSAGSAANLRRARRDRSATPVYTGG
jgi:hypothetical protein